MTPHDAPSPQGRRELIDGFGRRVTYLRVSVTDRCDLRCVYCMAEHMVFLPKAEELSLEELDRLARPFVSRATNQPRLTGRTLRVRTGSLVLVQSLHRKMSSGCPSTGALIAY